MAGKLYLTDRTLKGMAPAPPGHQYEIWDTTVPGFGVRVGDAVDEQRGGKAGRITFILYARFPLSPHPTRRALGRYGNLTLEQARAQARAWKEQIRQGIDPAIIEEEARQAKLREQNATFAAVAEKFIEHIKAKGERKAAVVEHDLRREFIKPWGHRPISSIAAHDIAAIIEATVKRGTRAGAHNLFGHVRRLFRWAIPLYIEHSPCALLSPVRLIGERSRRDRVLTDDELCALWRSAERMGYPYGPLYRLLALTGVRLSEACEAAWSEFDLQQRTWLIPAARMKKTKQAAKPHLVALTHATIEVIESLPRFKDGEFLFSNNTGKRPLKANHFSKPKARLDRQMLEELRGMAAERGDNLEPGGALPEWNNHDIRRTVRTNLFALKVPEEVREAVLAHGRSGIKGTHDPWQYLDEKREALTLWAGRLRAIVEPPPANGEPLCPAKSAS